MVFQLFGGDGQKVQYCSPSHPKVDAAAIANRKTAGGRLFLADISISTEAADKLDHNNIILLDHHKSAIPLAKYGWCQIDKENTRCGTKMFYEYAVKNSNNAPLYAKSLESLIDIIDDRDRWINKLPQTQDIHDLFTILGQESFVERFLVSPSTKLWSHESFMIQIERGKKKEYLKSLKVEERNINGRKIGFVCCDQRYITEAGHYLYDTHNLDACVLITPDTVSLRAPDHSDVDCSVIAKRFGGGGHRGAAGFQLKSLVKKSLLESVMENFNLDG